MPTSGGTGDWIRKSAISSALNIAEYSVPDVSDENLYAASGTVVRTNGSTVGFFVMGAYDTTQDSQSLFCQRITVMSRDVSGTAITTNAARWTVDTSHLTGTGSVVNFMGSTLISSHAIGNGTGWSLQVSTAYPGSVAVSGLGTAGTTVHAAVVQTIKMNTTGMG